MGSREAAKDMKKITIEELSCVVDVAFLLRFLRGLLVNFGAATCKQGCKQIVNINATFASSRLRVKCIE